MDYPNQGGYHGEQFPALLAQDGENFLEGLESLSEVDGDIPDSIWDAAGMVQHGAPTGSLDSLNSMNFHNPQACNFCSQFVAGTEQPAPGAPGVAYNENQTRSSHDEELNEQQCDQLIAETFGLLQSPTMPLGPPDASYSTDQFSPLPASGAQLPENQMPAEIQPLEQLDPAAEREWIKRERKRASDRKHRQKKKEERLELIRENEVKDQVLNALRAQIQTLEEQLQKAQQLQEKHTRVQAQKKYWKKQYRLLNGSVENNSRKENQLRARVKAMEKRIKNLKKKLKKQVTMAEKTAEETESDN